MVTSMAISYTNFTPGRANMKPLMRKSRDHSSSTNGKRLSLTTATETQRLSLLPDQNRLSATNGQSVLYNNTEQTARMK